MTGDFEEIYGSDSDDENGPYSGPWDAILTCFFIDTVCTLHIDISSHDKSSLLWSHVQAKNIVNYLRIIHKILAPGGVWINLGEISTLLFFECIVTVMHHGNIVRSPLVAF